MKYNEVIKNSREDADFKQYEFANELGILPKTYSMYENGLRGIPISVINKILRRLDLSLDYIFELSTTKKYRDDGDIDPKKLMIRIKEVRKLNHLSQNEMAKILSCNQQTLSEYERGNLIMPFETIKIFCKVNNVSADYITGRINYKPDNM